MKSGKLNKIKNKVSRGKGRPVGNSDRVGKEKLIEITRELLRNISPAKITRLDVANAASVDPGLIRYYFGDLSNLLTEVLKQMSDELVKTMEALATGPDSPRDKIRLRIKNFVQFGADNPAYYQLFVEQILYGDTEWGAEYRKEITSMGYNRLEEIIYEGRKSSDIREGFDERFLYITLIGASEFFFQTGRPIFDQLFPNQNKPNDLAEQFGNFLTDLIFRGIDNNSEN